MSLYQCCCPCFSNNHSEKDDFVVTQPQKSSNNETFSSLQQSRPRSYTTSQVQVAKLRPNSAQIKRNQYSNQRRNAAAYFRECNDIPMRCRINTFQLWEKKKIICITTYILRIIHSIYLLTHLLNCIYLCICQRNLYMYKNKD